MKFKINIFQKIFGAALVMGSALVVTGCVDDLKYNETGDLGAKVHGTLKVKFGSSNSNVSTRAFTNMNTGDNRPLKVNDYWVGLFDTKTGELIGMDYQQPYRKADGSRYTLYDDSDSHVIESRMMDVDYYQNNPEAYVVGVINYGDVLGKMAGETETKDMVDLLSSVKSLEEFSKISVDVASVEKLNAISGNGGDVPIMMGFYTAERTNGHITVSGKGEVSHDAAKVRLINKDSRELELAPGAIRLQRLVSDINILVMDNQRVPINVPSPISEQEKLPEGFNIIPLSDEESGITMEITSLAFKVFNSPEEVFLVEHATDRNADKHESHTDFLASTANSADHTGAYKDGADNEAFTYFGQNSYDGRDEEGFTKVHPATYWIDDEGPRDVYMIHYQHYENKHYGVSDIYKNGPEPHAMREAKHDASAENPVFKSLCPSEEKDWNNNASYVVLKVGVNYSKNNADKGEEEVYSGYVYYTIHEGYTSPMIGSSSVSPDLRDFESVRNTSYYYFVRIRGIEQLLMHVGAADFGDVPDYSHNDGITGSLSGDKYNDVSPYGATYECVLPPMTKEQRNEKLQLLYGIPRVYGDWSELEYYGYWNGIDPLKEIDLLSEVRDININNVGEIRRRLGRILTFYKESDANKDNPMTLQQYLDASDEEIGNEFITVNISPYEVKNFNDLDYIDSRFFLFYVKDFYKDDDGCEQMDLFRAFIQKPIDERVELVNFEPITFHTYPYQIDGEYYDDYTFVKGMADKGYIYWYAATAQYESEEPTIFDDNPNKWGYNYSSDDYNLHEPIAYKITIDDGVPITIPREQFDQYRHHTGKELRFDEYVDYCYRYEINLNEMYAGTHDVVIEAIVNNEKVKQPEPIVRKLIIAESPYWNFDGNTFPVLGSVNGYFSYNGMLATPGVNVHNGYIEFPGSGRFESVYYNGGFSRDNVVLRFDVAKHGKFRITVRHGNANSTQPTRYIYLAARENWTPQDVGRTRSTGKGITYNDNQSEVIELRTRDVIDSFKDGEPIQMGIYCNNRLYVHDIEFIPDSDQRPGLDTSGFGYTNQSKPESGYPDGYYGSGSLFHVMHPYSNYQYLKTDGGDTQTRYYIIPGFGSYFGFTDNNPRAIKYRLGIYEDMNDKNPKFTQEFEAEKYRTYESGSDGRSYPSYFAVPLLVPEGILERGKFYAIAITPIGDNTYADGVPHFLSCWFNSKDNYMFTQVIEEEIPDWSFNKATGYKIPWKDNGWVEFENIEGEFCDYFGIVIHAGTKAMGGSSSMYMSTNENNEAYVYFDGSGYPYAKDKGIGRYLSFMVDKPGKIKIVAQASNPGRNIHLYKSTDLTTSITSVPVTYEARSEVTLETGDINELTEFFIAPQGSFNMYSIKFER